MIKATASALLLAVGTTQVAAWNVGSGGRVMWDFDCDFSGHDWYQHSGDASVCGDACADNGGCSHWSWNGWNGGTCYMKTGGSNSRFYNQGVGCGYVLGRFNPDGGASFDNGLSSDETNDMFNCLNAARAGQGLPALRFNAQLMAAATGHSRDQANRCQMNHVGSDGSDPGVRIQRAGYAWSAYAENVAAGQVSVGDAMDSWLKSQGHYDNIMNRDVYDVGFAKAENGNCGYRTFWTQVFARHA